MTSENNDNKSFIDGSWYEKQYSTPGERYHDMYRGQIPEWAKNANSFHVAQVMTWLYDVNEDPAVLEVGCGVGNYLFAWGSKTHQAWGVDVSASAAQMARLRGEDVAVARADELVAAFTQWKHPPRGGFDLVFTAAVMEHIDVSVTKKALQEFAKVAPLQAHYIPLEKGDDPSHIHVQPVEAWVAEFKEALPGYRIYVVDNALERTQPLYIVVDNDLVRDRVLVLDHAALRGSVRRFA